jgi:hypothetical protein
MPTDSENVRSSGAGSTGFAAAGNLFGALTLRNVVVDNNDRNWLVPLVTLQRQAAGNDHLAAVLPALRKLAFPAASTDNFFLDLLEGYRKDRLEQLLTDSANRLLRRPPVHFLRAAVPVLNGTIHIAHDDGAMSEI